MYSVLYTHDGQMREHVGADEARAWEHAREQARSPLVSLVTIREVVYHLDGGMPTVETLMAKTLKDEAAKRVDELEEEVTRLIEVEADPTDRVAEMKAWIKGIGDILTLAMRHWDDARAFGWTDRLKDAEELIVDAMCAAGDLAA
jgi:hypothetical protein